MPWASHRYQTPSGGLGYTNPKHILAREVALYVANGYEVLWDPDDDPLPDELLVEAPHARRRRPEDRDLDT